MILFDGVSKFFGEVKALDNITFRVEDGDFIYVVGSSGSGKTTLLRLILGEYFPDKGKVVIDNQDLSKLNEKQILALRRSMGVVFQDFKVINDKTVFENVEMPLAVNGIPQKEWNKKVMDALRQVNLIKRAYHFPSQLSGGELQRVAIARAIVTSPRFILADEPTGNLDWSISDEILKILETINKKNVSVIMATHNEYLVKKYKKKVIEL